MKLKNTNLCYSLNVFPSEENLLLRLKNIGDKFNKIRQTLDLADITPFALGFWSDAVFVEQMKEDRNLQIVKKFLKQNNFYVFTVNAFPYGQFHSTRVKEKVYTPDWTTGKRRDFTCNAASFLANLIPVNTTGSISTLPGGYKQALSLSANQDYKKIIAKNLLYVASHLANIHKTTGVEIVLAIEMEPDCLWDNISDFIQFFNKYLGNDFVARKYLGVCYDTAHQELTDCLPGEGLNMLQTNGIKIAKIQLSAALKTADATFSGFDSLKPFSDEVYLHQTRLFNSHGKILDKYADIPETPHCDAEKGSYLISHFHIPLFCSELPGNISAANTELLAVLKQLKKSPAICSNIEIETYTYNVLPKLVNHREIEESIALEYKWILGYGI